MTSHQNNPRAPAATQAPRRRRFLGERGSIAIQTALILVAVLGMVALGAEVSTLLLQHRRMQTAADQAAIAGASALNTGSNYTVEAQAISAAHGFTDGVDSATVTVNRPPSTGPKAGNPDYVEVYVGQPQTFGISQLFHSGAFAARARGVAYRYGGQTGSFCMLALDPTSPQAIFLNNNISMANPTCGLASNSSSTQSIYLSNNTVVSGPVYTHGGTYVANGASFSQSPRTNQPLINDPYGGVVYPPYTGACKAALTRSGASSITNLNTTGGNCWLGWNFGNKATLNLSPGVYYVQGGLTFGNNVNVNGPGGVTIIVASNYQIAWGNGANLNITAPTSGTFQGIAITGLPSVTTLQSFPNNVNLNVVGAIYFRGAAVRFDNNLLTSASKCTQLIANQLQFYNNVGFNYQCAGTGVIPIGATSAALSE